MLTIVDSIINLINVVLYIIVYLIFMTLHIIPMTLQKRGLLSNLGICVTLYILSPRCLLQSSYVPVSLPVLLKTGFQVILVLTILKCQFIVHRLFTLDQQKYYYLQLYQSHTDIKYIHFPTDFCKHNLFYSKAQIADSQYLVLVLVR